MPALCLHSGEPSRSSVSPLTAPGSQPFPGRSLPPVHAASAPRSPLRPPPSCPPRSPSVGFVGDRGVRDQNLGQGPSPRAWWWISRPPGVTPRVTRHRHRWELSRGSGRLGWQWHRAAVAALPGDRGSAGGSVLASLFRRGSKDRRCLRLRETWRGWAMGSSAAGGRDSPTHEHAERVGMSIVSIGKQAKYARIPACPRGTGAPPSPSPPLWLIQYSHRCESFHPPSAFILPPQRRLHPDRRRKVSGQCGVCPAQVQAASAYGQQGLSWAGLYSPWLRNAFPCPALALLAGQ